MLQKLKSFNLPEIEERVLKFWRQNQIFEKSLRQAPAKSEARQGRQDKQVKDYVFYDGPPFANGLPHYGHILASIIKDVIPRYQTMKGRRVERKWGWDCHGLPVEYETEKELKLRTKKDIEKFGIEKFNEAAKSSVLRYVDDWKKIIPRIGRWVDMENDYKTMDPDYMESVWWVFKTLFEKKLAYEGYKSMHICPRCETTLANFEVAEGYQEIKDSSITVKFELNETKNKKLKAKSYLLAWTTTPWTLPGNVALAVNPKVDYVLIKIKKHESRIKENYILAKERISEIDAKYEIVKTFKGKVLVGKKYKPLFDYYQHKSILNQHQLMSLKNGWKIYPAEFVKTDEGTGIVHVAPAFGEEDMSLAKKYNLPFIQHVAMNGRFKKEVKDFAGLEVKPKDQSLATDKKIIAWLKKQNKVFKSGEIIHAYPHCWRCETPLLNYAASSWFIKVTAFKKKLIGNNKKIIWIPTHIKEGRFGQWLKEARDWAVSRSRFWGAPLPVWKCQKCQKIKVIGSIEEIKKNIKKSGNKYFIMRHAEAESNIKNIVSSTLETSRLHHLTEKGKNKAFQTAKKLKNQNIDLIFSSDFTRSRETAKIITNQLGRKKIIFDKRLREINAGIFNGKKTKEYHDFFSSMAEKFTKTPPQGENLGQVRKRVAEFLYEIEHKYKNKNILIVSHDYPTWLIFAIAAGADTKKAVTIMKGKEGDFIRPGDLETLDFTPLPHNKDYIIDLHRPYIDKIEFLCSCGGNMKRIGDVFDCWFESGSMPYGQAHYPFENKEKFEKNFPAEFIAEGIDQTRGWFYTLFVLSTALFNKPAFKNVVVNGIILAEDGQKMSKRLKNYPDPVEVVNKYGADALRLYLLSSPVVRAENINFSEKGVDETYKKVILRLLNVYNFYEMYADKKLKTQNSKLKTNNVLDQWILARLNKLTQEITKAMDSYQLDFATRPINEFIDDLSTWYVRRSRRRFQKIEDKNDYLSGSETLRYVLIETSKLIAPFLPFIAEAIYRQLKTQNSPPKAGTPLTEKPKAQSVHLESWPMVSYQNQKSKIKNQKILDEMAEIRRLASLALAKRAEAGIKVRQPLVSLKIKNSTFTPASAKATAGKKASADRQKSKIKNNNLLQILADEINVKKIIFDDKIKDEIELDTKITAELREEGTIREFVRMVQDLRQKNGYQPKDIIYLFVETTPDSEKILNHYLTSFKKEVGAKNIEFRRSEKFDSEIETNIDSQKIWIGIKKVK